MNCREGADQKFKQAELFFFQTVPDCITGYSFLKLIIIISDLPYIPCLKLGGKLSLWLYYGNQE